MKKCGKNLILWILGGMLYIALELVWRGHSHWTMFVLGGLCFGVIGLVNERIPWDMPIWQQALIGSGLITILEFITGCIVNLYFGWNIWDYSNMPLNILGQICVSYMILWIPVSAGAVVLDDWLRFYLFGEEKPNYIWRRK